MEPHDDYPRVTHILREVGLMPHFHGGEFAMDRGTKAHLALEYEDVGDLDEDSLAPELRGYLEAWRRFKRESGCEILSIEERVENSTYQYRGTLDRRLKVNGVEGIADAKTGSPSPFHAIQLAAYSLCFDRHLSRWAVYLTDSGTYSLIEHKDRSDYAIFKSAVTLFHYRRRHGLTNV